MRNLWGVLLLLCWTVGAAGAQAGAQYDLTIGQYQIEPEARLVLSVDNPSYGQALLGLWDSLHPEAAGAVVLADSENSRGADVAQIRATYLAATLSEWTPLDGYLVKAARETLDYRAYKGVNEGLDWIVALPIAYQGVALGWDKRGLEALGYTLESVDTWEKIFALSRNWPWKRPLFSFPLSENLEILVGSEVFRTAAEVKVPAENEEALALLALVTPQTVPVSWEIAELPSWKGVRPSSWIDTQVVVARTSAAFPSAASELVRLMFSKKGLQLLVDQTSMVPVLVEGSVLAPDDSLQPLLQQWVGLLRSSARFTSSTALSR